MTDIVEGSEASFNDAASPVHLIVLKQMFGHYIDFGKYRRVSRHLFLPNAFKFGQFRSSEGYKSYFYYLHIYTIKMVFSHLFFK